MREYGQIQCSFWSDPDIQGMSDDAKLLACYLMTGPHSNGLGCYRLPDGYLQADLGWKPERILKGFLNLFETGFAVRCNTTGWVVIPKFLKWNKIANPKIALARIQEINVVQKKASIYPLLMESVAKYGGKHMPADFMDTIKASRRHVTARIPDATRDFIMERDAGRCVRCQSDQDVTLDHIFPVAIGGTHAASNLRVMCRSCNSGRPASGEGLAEDLALDGLSMDDKDRICEDGKDYLNGIDKVSEGSRNREKNKNKKGTERESLSGKPDVSQPSDKDSEDEEPETPKETPREQARRVLAFLNEKTGRNYQDTDTNLDFIVCRLREGYTESMCRMVIARKFREWAKDDKMASYLRPATLFNREKFNQYAGECVPPQEAVRELS